MKNKEFQMSESILLAIFLAIGGGFRDAYSYNLRGHVFANAQTGNLALFSQALANLQFHTAFKFVFPIVAFIIGIYLTDLIKFFFKNNNKIHWRQIIVLIEVLMLIIVGYIPAESNHLANTIISLACAMQVETFRKFLNFPMATTMCTGNLRSGTEALVEFSLHKDSNKLKKSLYYFLIITMFCTGVALGAISGNFLGLQSIWLDSIIMFFIFLLMFKK